MTDKERERNWDWHKDRKSETLRAGYVERHWEKLREIERETLREIERDVERDIEIVI